MAATQIKAIQTSYRGYRFRSRLEARWAVCFDAESIQWEYEPQGFDLGDEGPYLPDFWLPQVSMWAEVKADTPTIQEIRKAAALAHATGHVVMLFVEIPDSNSYWGVHGWAGTRHCRGVGGWDHDLIDGSMVEACDYAPFEGHGYHLYESRFFADSGMGYKSFPLPISMPVEVWGGSTKGIIAARSARFEHGDSPES